MVQALAAGTAIHIKGVALRRQAGLDGQHGVRVVLFHRRAADLHPVVGLGHGIEIPQQQVRDDALRLADAIARIGGQDQIAGSGRRRRP